MHTEKDSTQNNSFPKISRERFKYLQRIKLRNIRRQMAGDQQCPNRDYNTHNEGFPHIFQEVLTHPSSACHMPQIRQGRMHSGYVSFSCLIKFLRGWANSYKSFFCFCFLHSPKKERKKKTSNKPNWSMNNIGAGGVCGVCVWNPTFVSLVPERQHN